LQIFVMPIARIVWTGVRIAHLQLPARDGEDGETVTLPGAIAVGFNGQKNAIVQLWNGRTTIRELPLGTVGLSGSEPVRWLKSGRSDVVEISASRAVRHQVAAELSAEEHVDLDDLFGWDHIQCRAIALRFRAAARGTHPLSEVEADALTRRLYAIVLANKFGGRWAERSRLPLDTRRLRRVLVFIEAHINAVPNAADALTLDRLADVTGFSPFHFSRTFRSATGWAPCRYVNLRRLELARRRLLNDTESVQSIALDLGYSNLSHFRRQFVAHTGQGPGAFRSAG
jgi:AraC family transcriptional regulator